MLSIRKWLLFFVVVSLPLVGFAKIGESNETLVGGCDDTRECEGSFQSQAFAQYRLCQSSDLSVSWIQGSGRYLIRCENGSTAEDNVVWIVDRNSEFFGRLNYGRMIRKSAVERSPNLNISDKFVLRRLCHPTDIIKLKESDFLLLDKKPADLEDAPYCYDITYLKLRERKLVIETSRGMVAPSDLQHAVQSVSTADRERLTHLLDVVRLWHPQP